MIAEPERSVAPYAPVEPLLNLIRRFRDRGLPSPVTIQELQRLGISAGNAPRVLTALRFLGLADDEGRRTEAFERVRRASTQEYPEVLAEIVRAAYEPVFTVVDPAIDDEVAIHDAFRHYQPQAQRSRMVALFLGLAREANMIPGGPVQRRRRKRRISAERIPSRPSRQVIRPEPMVDTSAGQSAITHNEGGVDYRLISALMQQLPRDGRWAQAKRDKWIQAVSAAVDLLTDITEEEDSE